MRLVLEFWDGLMDDVSEKVNKDRSRLDLCPVGGEGESVLCNFKQCNSEGPDVGGDGVGLSSDSLRGHVVGCANKSVCIALGPEFAAYTKVTKFDLAVAAEKDIRRFYICRHALEYSNLFQRNICGEYTSVDDLSAVQVCQTVQDALGNLSEHLLSGSTAKFLNFSVYAVQTAAFA